MSGVRAVAISARSSKVAVRSELAEVKRARIIGAMLDIAGEKGCSGVTISHLIDHAGVSRRTFYELFEDREDCFLATFEQALAYASERVLPAFEIHKGWREQVRAALIRLLSLFDQDPAIGRVLVNESLTAGPKTCRRRGEVLATVTAVIAAAASETRNAHPVSSSFTAEGIVGGVLSVVGSRLAQRDGSLLELAGPLMSMIVLPYFGPAAARRELERSVPAPVVGRRRPEQLLKDPFKDHGLRLTYRTVRVLAAIAEHPGASNRLIADTADITDQGQVSKLLTRLERSKMIAKVDLAPEKGAPNSWTLTDSGQRIVTTIQTHSEGCRPGGDER